MDWQTLAWEHLDGDALAEAASLVEFSEILRGAVEESTSALAQAPISIAGASVARVPSFALLAADVEPIATFELMAAARRQLFVGMDRAAGTSLAGAGVVSAVLGRAIIEGLDGAFADLIGEGISLGPADAAGVPDDAPVLVLRFQLRGPDGTGVDLLGVVEDAVPAELAAHVVALRALGTVDAGPRDAAPRAVRPAPSPADMQAAADATLAALQAAAALPANGAPEGGFADLAGSVATAAHAAPSAAAPAVPAMSAAAPSIRPAAFDELTPRAPERPTTSLDLLLGVNLQVTVEIGRTRLQIREILGLAPGSIVELDKLAGEPVDVLVNGRQIATGEVVVVDENFGVRITEIVSRQRRIAAGAASAA